MKPVGDAGNLGRLAEQRRLLHVDQTPLGVVEWDTDFCVTSWNPAAERIFGYSARDALGCHARDLIIPSEFHGLVDVVWRALCNGHGGERSDNENVTKDGRTIHCEWYNTPLRDSDGALVGVASLVHDITDRVMAERELRDANERLNKQVEEQTHQLRQEVIDRTVAEHTAKNQMMFLEALIDTIPIPLFSETVDGNFLQCNSAYADFVGRSREIILSSTLEDVLDPEQAALHLTYNRMVLEAGTAQQYELRRPNGLGEIRDVVMHNAPFRTHTGQAAGLVGVIVDITDMRVTEQALKDATVKAQHANSMKSTFLSNISHELRTPLNAIIGFSSLMLEMDSVEPSDKVYVRDIQQSGQYLLDLINGLLDVSAIEAGGIDLAVQPVEIREVVGYALKQVEGRAKERNVALTCQMDENLPDIAGDETRVRQIFINLLSNAVKFTPSGGSITIGARHESNVCVLTVEDTGPGMTADEVKVALTPFGRVRAKGAVYIEGTGLGLPLVKGLVEAHGGQLDMESEPGKGTKVTVSLPTDLFTYSA